MAELDENAAAAIVPPPPGLTGEPKGVLYSHLSLFLHSYGALCMVDRFALAVRATQFCRVIPMFPRQRLGHSLRQAS